ncbi:MAG: GNAT family N-acetyltransferase [Shimia sp.]
MLAGSPHGVVYLAGPRVAPLGYAVVTFGWSIEFGGLDAWLDEIYVRAQVRGRGIGGDMLFGLVAELRDRQVKGLSLEVDRGDAATQKLYSRVGFEMRARYALMTRRFG